MKTAYDSLVMLRVEAERCGQLPRLWYIGPETNDELIRLATHASAPSLSEPTRITELMGFPVVVVDGIPDNTVYLVSHDEAWA
jgi:hypothetical protein